MNPQAEALKARTKKYALDVLEFVDTLPKLGPAVRVGLQLSAAATSVAANYRAACRARSKAEFAAKIGIVLEEGDESLLWMEITKERGWGSNRLNELLLREGNELVAIFAQSSITARQSLRTVTR